MAGLVHGHLRPVLIAVCCLLLLQVSECSIPSPSPADHLDDDALHHLGAEARTAWPPTSMEVAGDGRTGSDDDDDAAQSASASTTPARAVPAVIATSRPPLTTKRALVRAGRTPEVLLLCSRRARRFLAGAGVDDEAGSATDGTAPSCHSYNPHINCPPALKP